MRLNVFVLLMVYSCSDVLLSSEIEEVKSAWLQRQNSVTNFRFSWDEVQMRMRLDTPLGGQHDGSGNVVKAQFAFENGMYRYDKKGVQWEGRKNGYVDFPFVTASNGEDRVTYFGASLPGEHDKVFPLGFLDTPSKFEEKGNVNLLPLLTCYRGCVPDLLPFNLDNYSVSGRPVVFKGGKCLKLMPSEKSVDAIDLLVDPNHHYVPVQIVRRIDRAIRYTVEISYDPNAALEARPSSWRINKYRTSDQRLYSVAEATVTIGEINCNIARDTFDFQCPVGTMVEDLKSGSTFIVGKLGRKRPVLATELARGARYSDLVSTASGEAKMTKTRRVLYRVRVPLLVCTFFAFVVLYVSHLRRKGR